MKQVGIPVLLHRAVQMTKKDYREYDYLIGMDEANIRNMMRIAGGDPEGKFICYLITVIHQGLLRIHGIQEILTSHMMTLWKDVLPF